MLFFQNVYLCLSCFGIIISGKVQKRIARGRNDQKALMTYDEIYHNYAEKRTKSSFSASHMDKIQFFK